MTRVLFQMGARRIAYLGGSGTYTVNADRLRGYLRGLAEFGASADQSLIRTGIESDEQRTRRAGGCAGAAPGLPAVLR